MAGVEGIATAGLNPIGSALNAITGIAGVDGGGPSSAYAEGGTISSPFNIGGNNFGQSNGIFDGDFLGVPTPLLLSLIILAAILAKK